MDVDIKKVLATDWILCPRADTAALLDTLNKGGIATGFPECIQWKEALSSLEPQHPCRLVPELTPRQKQECYLQEVMSVSALHFAD